MSDIEYQVIDRLRTKLQEFNQDIYVPQEFIEETATFPTVTVTEISNTPVYETRTTKENMHDKIVYQVDIYTKGETKKTDNKEIQEIVNNFFMKELGMNRTTKQPISNLANLSICRYVMRFEGIIDINTNIIYRRS